MKVMIEKEHFRSVIDRSRPRLQSDNFCVTTCTCKYCSILSKVIPLMSQILVKLPQNKFENDKYRIGKDLDFQRLVKMNIG